MIAGDSSGEKMVAPTPSKPTGHDARRERNDDQDRFLVFGSTIMFLITRSGCALFRDRLRTCCRRPIWKVNWRLSPESEVVLDVLLSAGKEITFRVMDQTLPQYTEQRQSQAYRTDASSPACASRVGRVSPPPRVFLCNARRLPLCNKAS